MKQMRVDVIEIYEVVEFTWKYLKWIIHTGLNLLLEVSNIRIFKRKKKAAKYFYYNSFKPVMHQAMLRKYSVDEAYI